MMIKANQFQEDRALMLFDGVCVFCSRSVKFVSDRSNHEKINFCPMQSEQGRELLLSLDMSDVSYETLVVIYKGKTLTKSQAIIRLMKLMKGVWPMTAEILAVFPISILDKAYDVIARNRYKIFGKSEFCYLPERSI